MAQRHMLEYGTTEKQLGQIAVTCRERANANPRAQMHDRPLTMDDYLSARMISRPLRLYDFCLETDGACAVVVTSTDRARDLRQKPALIRAVAQNSIPDPQPGIQFPVLMRDRITELPAKAVAKTLYARAGLGPQDVDVAQVYDCFTITVLLQLEDWGFCAKGEGGPFVASGEIDLGGSIPINTGGGHLSEGYIHGMNHIVEGVRQIRGRIDVTGARRRGVPRHVHPAPAGQRPDADGAMRTHDRDTTTTPARRRRHRHGRVLRSGPPPASWPSASATGAAPCCTCPGPTATRADRGRATGSRSPGAVACTRGRRSSTRCTRPSRCPTRSC